jgi:hypothetical protein
MFEQNDPVEKTLHSAWKRYGRPAGMPSRIDSVFATSKPNDWKDAMSHMQFLVRVYPLDERRTTIRDARHYSRVFQTLTRLSGAKDEAEKRAIKNEAALHAKSYWTKSPGGVGAQPEILIEGGVQHRSEIIHRRSVITF